MSLFNRCARVAVSLTIMSTVLVTQNVFAHEGREVGEYDFVVGFISEPAVEGLLNGVAVQVTSNVAEDSDHDDTESDHSSTPESGIDLVSHGAVFVGELEPRAEFSFTFDSKFDGLTVPFHAHPIETDGSIHVAQGNSSSGDVTIEIFEDRFEPVMTMIKPGTTVTFKNRMDEPTVAMSGVNSVQESAENRVSGITSLQVEISHKTSPGSKVLDLEEDFNQQGDYFAEFIPTAPGAYVFRIFGDIDGQKVDESFESSNTTFDEVTPANEIQFPVQIAAPREVENAARGALIAANEAGVTATNAEESVSNATLLSSISLILALVGLAIGGVAFVRSNKRQLEI